MSGAPILQCEGLDVAYGSVQVLFGVDLHVDEGEIVALLGTNGAGKSTLLKAVAGLLAPAGGRVRFAGRDITGVPAERLAHDGIALMPGGRSVFPTLNVAENLRLGGWLLRGDGTRRQQAVDDVLDLFPALRNRIGTMAGDLSGGEQQMLALAQAFMHRPRLLMIDELSLGLAPTIVAELLELVRRIHATGTTIVLVEQSVNVALTVAERALFMEKGEVRFQGPTAQLLERPDILRSVFIAGATGGLDADVDSDTGAQILSRGVVTESATEALEKAHERNCAAPASGDEQPVLLRTDGITKSFGVIRAVNGVGLELRRGEIVGLIGPNGAGKTTVLDCISGFVPIDGGRVELRGRDVTDWAPYQRALGGLGRSFQEARLYPTLTAEETIAVALERHLECRNTLAAALDLPASFVSEVAARHRVAELIELVGLSAYAEKLISELSTGTRRIVDLACVLAQDPSVLLLDEPSAGVAQRETEALGPLLVRVRDHTGCALLVVEHDMPLLTSICDELIALEQGTPIARGTPREVLEHPRVVESYLGTDEAAIHRSGSGTADSTKAAPQPARNGRGARRREPLRAGSRRS